MKSRIYFFVWILFIVNPLFGQEELPDTTINVKLMEVIITSNRLPVRLKSNPGSVSLVTSDALSLMPKAVGVEEALRLVPGVRIDNQHDGERVHVSIRGQGILTERGLRGIGVLIDGIPVNDPSGFAPDLYDVEWATVKSIEVLRGPVAGLYGGGASAGILNIVTDNGTSKPISGLASQSFGSNGFMKSLIQLDGSKKIVDYRMTYSRTGGDGYRDHQAFRSNKLYEKINFKSSEKLLITQVFSYIRYFQQNPEGLKIGQFDNLRQANPDARQFNEYQKTNRVTAGAHGSYKISGRHDFEITAYLHSWNYKETSNKCAEYRTIMNPGGSAQYNLHFTLGKVKNTFGLGVDLKWQNIDMHKLQSAGDPNRIEKVDETNLETDSLLANQIISQQSTGFFGIYKLDFGKFSLMANLRFDLMKNQLTNKMFAIDSANTSKDFSRISGRIGANYSFSDAFILYANWSQGFLPPSTEELANNPTGYSGFNTYLVPAVSDCFETGIRGFISSTFSYELTGFSMRTRNDFFRFKQSGRGNQEVFYGNAGNSKRSGIEAFVSYNIIKNLIFQAAYTFSGYKYVSADIDAVYTDTAYVLTTPPAAGQWLPNSPRHQLYAAITWSIIKNLKLDLATEYQSKWAIYTDAKAYSGELDPAIYRNWQDGFNLWHARLSYEWKIKKI
ncbi:MAG: TonB-dependent receptor, partial [Bacteroidia bacterium]|nr:TonB-dependent receptor [Bacteroidia bacterium]